MAAKDLVASVLKGERCDCRVEWEDILPKVPLIVTQADIFLLGEKDEDKHVDKNACFVLETAWYIHPTN